MESKMNWDLTPFFPQFGGKEMIEFKEQIKKDLEHWQKTSAEIENLSAENCDRWEEVLLACEDLVTRLSHLSSYLGCLTAADANVEAYQQEEAAVSQLWAEYEKLEVELLRAIKEAPEDLFDQFRNRDALADASYFLGRMKEQATRTMSREKEILAADLGVDGMSAWGRLYETISGKLNFEMKFPDGEVKTIPISQRRTLMEDNDRRVREAAFVGGNEAWKRVEDVAATALNSIAGTRLTLNRHRGVEHYLEIALFQSAITRKSLDAMFEALYDNLDLSRSILRLKAKTMGLEKVAWYDLTAPLPVEEHSRIPWERGKEMVREAFANRYPALGRFMDTMYEKEWIDWEPREGKRPGGFCTDSLKIRESRIFMTYQGSLGDVRTLAHEAGHAFHNHILKDRRVFSTLFPMTLAESASTFGELVLSEGLLEDPEIGDTQKALLLDTEISHGAIFLLDIPVRFEFEKQLHEERQKGIVPVSRLKKTMVETQKRIFGDVLEGGTEDPWFWASKLHFYITGVTFYNFPYTFGFLLSRGLYAMFKEQGSEFIPRFEKFLEISGSDTAVGVAKQTLGEDLEQPDFWNRSIRSLEEPLKELEELLPRVLPGKR